MKIKIIPVTLLLATLFISQVTFSRSYRSGHEIDFKNVIEGLTGDNFEQLLKEISSGIDSELVGIVNKKFPGKMHYNHRLFGHWGFEGAIPFNHEPFKTYLKEYPKSEVIKIWQQYKNKLINRAMELTGLPKKQAKGLVGLIYNTHLLGDWVPGNKILDPLLNPQIIRKDIIKNLHRLFANNSNFVKQIEKELAKIPYKNGQQYAQAILSVLKINNIGSEINKYFSKILIPKGITYKHPFSKSFVKRFFNITEMGLFSKRIRDFSEFKIRSNKISTLNVAIKPGLLLKNGRLIVSAQEGAMAGIFVFATEAGIAGYQFYGGDVFRPEYERKLQDAAIKGATVGGGTAVAVFLGATPWGIVVFGVATGTYIITETTLQAWHKYQDGKYLNKEDLELFGIEYDSNFEIAIDQNIPLNADKW
jgi:hypothetical protein